jgi:hypothetical protein
LAQPFRQKFQIFQWDWRIWPAQQFHGLVIKNERKIRFEAPLCGYDLCAMIAAPDYRGYSTWTCQTL